MPGTRRRNAPPPVRGKKVSGSKNPPPSVRTHVVEPLLFTTNESSALSDKFQGSEPRLNHLERLR